MSFHSVSLITSDILSTAILFYDSFHIRLHRMTYNHVPYMTLNLSIAAQFCCSSDIAVFLAIRVK